MKGPERSTLARSAALIVPMLCASLLPAPAAAAHAMRPAHHVSVPRHRPAEVGIASWYGDEHAGRPMANGRIYDPNLLTAAHRSLPLGTRIRVTLIKSGHSVIVTVTDRGPYVRRRFIDLSRGAAEELGMTRDGLARVRIEFL